MLSLNVKLYYQLGNCCISSDQVNGLNSGSMKRETNREHLWKLIGEQRRLGHPGFCACEQANGGPIKKVISVRRKISLGGRGTEKKMNLASDLQTLLSKCKLITSATQSSYLPSTVWVACFWHIKEGCLITLEMITVGMSQNCCMSKGEKCFCPSALSP